MLKSRFPTESHFPYTYIVYITSPARAQLSALLVGKSVCQGIARPLWTAYVKRLAQGHTWITLPMLPVVPS